MTAKDFLRQRFTERRQHRFIPIQAFGFDEFEPVHLPRQPQTVRPTAGEAALASTVSPALSEP